jgi:hypothetical protein
VSGFGDHKESGLQTEA